ncbi:PAS domain S-box protein [Flavobacterium soyangense]|uniref:histidine kinase n=1 Tax=Flavobacterium soyangense TaxID=2023265 RepID=A0A930U6B3_9FLAO|nr:PAS domain S-box protein [Flavobacterium soyangense]MBF2707693.1 PAS domain S-box protein [Flavobacterium soyangense]
MKDKTNPLKATFLRQKAEEILKKKSINNDIHYSDIEILKLVHELDVHQIELEMQNEELLLAKKKAENDAEKYTNLYDFAPSGYFTLSKEGEIMELNFRGADLLGKERSLLLNNRFALFVTDQTRPKFNLFLEELFDSNTRQTCELKLTKVSEFPTYVYLSGIVSEDREQCLLTMVDISQRKKAEKETKISEEKYRTLFETNRDSITIFRIDEDGKPGNFIEVNPATTTLFGYTKKELLAMSVLDIETISDKKRKSKVDALISKGKIDFETIIKNKKGNLRNVDIESIIINYLNEPAVMNIARDITERKQTEENSRKAQENLATILEAIPDILFEVGFDGRIHHYQAHREDLLAVPPAIFMGKLIQEILPPDVVKTCMEAIQEADAIGWSSGKQYALDLPQGKHWFELSVSPIKERSNINKHFIVLARDITVRKITEHKLRSEKERIRAILEMVGSPIFLKDNNYKVTYANSAFCNFFGLNEKSVIGKTLAQNFPKNEKIHFLKIDRNVLDTGIQDIREEKLIVKGIVHTVIISKTRFIDESGNKSLVGSFYDITDRKKAEKTKEDALNLIHNIASRVPGVVYQYLLRPDGSSCFPYASEGIREIYGVSPEEVRKDASIVLEKIHPDDLTAVTTSIQESAKSLTPWKHEYRVKFNDGIVRFLSGNAKPQKQDDGSVLWHGFISDVTEKKIIENSLRKSEEKIRNLLDSSDGIIWEADALTFNFTFVSKQAERLLGFPIQEWYSNGFWKNHIHPDDREQTIKYCISRTKLMESHDFTYRFIANNGKIVWLRDLVKVITEDEKPILLQGVMFDITKQKQVEESLRESEEKYRGLVENSPDAIVIYKDDRIAFMNDEGLRMLGAKNEEEIIGKPVLQFIHPDSLADVIQRMKEVVRDNNASATVEEKFIRLDGTPFDVEIKAIPTIYNHETAVQVIVHDITERKQSALELTKINRMYALISQINNLIIRTHNQKELFQEICNISVAFGKFRMSWIGLIDDNQRVITEAFAGFENGYFTKSNITTVADILEGRGPTGIVMREVKTVICNDIANDPIMKPWRKEAMERGYSSSISIPIIVRNKIIGAFNLYSEEVNFFSSEEEISLLEKIILNISFALEKIQIDEDRKRTEEKIRQLSQAVEQSPVTIVITNINGEIEYANPKFIETTGYTVEEVMSQNPLVLKSEYISSEEYKQMWETITEGKEWHGEFHNKRKDGTLFWESATISPILNDEGKTTHFIAIKEDITDRKKAEKELVKSKERAEESDRLKLAFLANMSHEIRTPMNGILGFTELLKEPKLSGEEQQEYINIIEKSGKRMLNIINDIISISKVESGQIEVSLSETNVNEQIEYIYTFFKPEAKQKGIELLVSKQLASKDTIINTDREKVYAVLTNLVKNAIKFTNEGSIEFGCEKKGGYLEFHIKDTGLGISKSQKKIIFERFRQVSDSISRSHEGSGLGLAISKAYVEMLGGKIWVESKEGKGSTFYFTIPFHSENKTEEKNFIEKAGSAGKEENKIKDLKVLIVEDDAISKLLITIAVKPYSKEIIKVSTGIEAIEACRNNPDIDLVMMDINMPEMGGYEATNLIREFNKDLVIIAQTANGMQSDRDNAIAAGCTDYISKPINITSLGELIQKYFKK